MVGGADKPSNDVGILQTMLSHREGYEARHVGLETRPLDHNNGTAAFAPRERDMTLRNPSVHSLGLDQRCPFLSDLFLGGSGRAMLEALMAG